MTGLTGSSSQWRTSSHETVKEEEYEEEERACKLCVNIFQVFDDRFCFFLWDGM
jgi:hypothetical protein